MLGWQSTVGAERDGEPAERLSGWRFSASTFRALGVTPQLGRVFTPEEDVVGAPENVVIISDQLWRTRFAADPAVIGRTMVLDGTTCEVVGVMPPGFGVFDTQSDFWIPSPFSPLQVQSRSANRVLTIVGRLKPEVSIQRAQSDIEAINSALAAEDPIPQKGIGIRVQPLDTVLFGNLRLILRVLQGAVAFVLLIACANVAGLLLVRATARQKEVAIRRALGANRSRIVRLFLTESLLLSLAGGILGIALARLAVQAVVAATPQWLSAVQRIEVNTSVLVFTVVISFLTALGFGMVPVLGVSNPDLTRPLRESSRGVTGGRGHRRVQSMLVVAQVALTLVLLVGAGLLMRSFWQLQRVDLGIEPERVLSFDTRLPANRFFRQVGARDGFTQLEISPVPATLFDRMRERLRAVPGVESAAGANVLPVGGFGMQAPFRIEGRVVQDPGVGVNAAFGTATDDLLANYTLVTPDFFETMRIPIAQGREFTPRDDANAVPVVVINQAMARRYWPSESPIGKRVTVTIVSDEQPREIVGVVGDTPTSRWDRSPAPALYVPHLQESLRSRTPYGQSRVNLSFVLRITQPVASVVPAVRRAMAEVDASLPVSQIQMMEDMLDRQVDTPRDSMVLVGIFGAIALLLAALGIYGIVAYGVVQRTHEIGIRMALGARRASVLGLVLRQSTMLTLAGLVLGLSAAAVLTTYLETLLFNLTPLDVTTFAAMPVLFALTAALAAYLPARRATRLDPQAVLRCD